jgi:antitoxin ParD1/3/4
MTTMNISLPDEMKVFVEAQMAQEGYASASEYLRALIRDAQKRRAKRELEAKFREALESGPATPMTSDREGTEHGQGDPEPDGLLSVPEGG